MHASVELAAEVAGRGGQMLDAPVTGGVWGAQNATLRFFVGGDKTAFDRAQDVFGTLGKLAVYIGPSGHGQIGKMVCQMIGSVEYAVAAEALALAESVGADTRSIAQVLGERHVMQRMIDLRDSGNLGSEGYTAQRGKDIDYAVEEAMRNGSEIPVTRAVKTVFDAARAQGLGDCDPLALYRLWQEGYHH
jgi:2-hydroxy-3-oxopropionate reductase